MAANLDTDILAPLLVTFVALAAGAAAKAYALMKEKEALIGKISDLTEKLAAAERHRKEHLDLALDAYCKDIDGKKQQIEKMKISHNESDELIAFLVSSLERLKPGWLRARADGKPEYELVFTDAPKRPPPPPRSTKGAVNPPSRSP